MTVTTHAFLLKPIAAGIRGRTALRLGCGALAALPGLVLAGPAGEQLAAGAATVARPDASQTLVTQTSQQAVMNWQSFSIAGNEYVKFVQPGTNAAILNRVVGSDMSSILGRLEANGRVFLVNPRGVYFAPGAQVDVGALGASVLDIRDDDFMNGRYVFAKSPSSPDGAAVVNEGRISTNGPGGFVVLLGERAENAGLISARLGTVALAAGSKVTLDINQDGLVNFAVDEQAVSSLAGVRNAGQIVADGGRVVMTAKVADGLLATAVNNEGLVRAHSIQEHGGEIELAASGGNVVNTGALDVAGEQGQSGGNAVVFSDKNVVLAPQSTITASGEGAGAGGTVRVIADGHLNFAAGAQIVAEGGATGTGGKLELSGHKSIALKGSVALGEGGHLFIDPGRVKLLNNATSAASGSGSGSGSTSFTTVGKTFIENQLKSGVNVSIIATQEIFAASNMAIDATSGLGAGNLKLGIGSYSGGTCAFGVCAGSPGFFPGASGSIHLAGVNIAIRGNFEAQAGNSAGDVQIGHVSANRITITANRGDIATGNLTVNNSGSANIALAANTIRTAALTAITNNSYGSASIDITSRNGLSITGEVTATGGRASIDINNGSTGNLAITGNVLATATRGSASIWIGNSAPSSAGGLRIVGDVTARSLGTSSGSASIDLYNRGGKGIAIQGNLTAIGGGRDAEIRLDNSSGGISVSGNITATAPNAWASIDLYNGSGGAINVGGNIIATAGTSEASIDLYNSNGSGINVGGSVIAAAAASSASVSFYNGGTGAITVGGNVTATGASDASIELYNSNGSGITVGGSVVASGGIGSASIYLYNGGSAGGITVAGDVTAIAGRWEASVDITNYGNAGIRIGGNVSALAAASSASIDIRNHGGGDVAIAGNVSVRSSNSDGSIDIRNDNGGIAVNGNIAAQGRLKQRIFLDATGPLTVSGAISATAASSTAEVDLTGSTVNVLGGIAVHGVGSTSFNPGTFSSSYGGSSFRGGLVDVLGANGVNLGGVTASGPGFAGIRVRNSTAGTIAIGGPVSALGGSAGYVAIRNGGAGGIQTVGSGILVANTGVLLGDDGGGPVSVQTSAPFVTLSVPGTTLPSVAIDNRSFVGSAALSLSRNFYGPSGSPGTSGSGMVHLGSAKFGFSGNAMILGDFSAQNLYVEVNGGGLFIPGAVLVGDVPLPNQVGDDLLIKALSLAVRPDGKHLDVPEYQGQIGVGPNAVFIAQSGIMIGSQSFAGSGGLAAGSGGLAFDDPDTPYVLFQSDGPVLTGAIKNVNRNAKSFIAQYAAYTSSNPIQVEGQFTSGASAVTGFYADTNFKTLPGTTILIGGVSLPSGRPTGTVTIGSAGAFDIGDQNMLFASGGGVSGIRNVKSTGFIADLELLLAPVTGVFKPPVVGEFNRESTNHDRQGRRNTVDTEEGGEGGEGGGLITQQSNKGQLCQ